MKFNPIEKFLSFFRRKKPALQEIIDAGIPRYEMDEEQHLFDSPFVTLVVRPSCSFWKRTWHILLPVIVASIVALFIHFDGKTCGEAKNKTDTDTGTIKHVSPQ